MEPDKIDLNIKIGFDIQEFLLTDAGQFLSHLLQTKLALTCTDMALKKHSTGDSKGQYICQTLGELERYRGFAEGIQWIMDELRGRINKAKRLDSEINKNKNK